VIRRLRAAMRGRLALLAAATACACAAPEAPGRDGGGAASGAKAPRLVVCSGGNVRAVLRELTAAFEKEARCDLTYTSGSPGGVLADSIRRRDADVYIVADLRHVRAAERQDVVAAKLPVAVLRLALVVGKGNPKHIRGLSDLSRPGLRVFVEDPNGCQVGEASRRLLHRNKVVPAASAAAGDGERATLRTIADFIEGGKLDVAVVWDEAAGRLRGKLDVVSIPPEQNVKVNLVAVVFRFARSQALAERFVLFLRSAAGRAVWKRHGFTPPPLAAAPGGKLARSAEGMVRASRGVLAPVYAPLAAQIAADYKLAEREGVGIDVGSGPGTLIVELCRRTKLHWVNADINPHFFPHFLRLAEAQGLGHRVGAIRADAKALPFRDNYADVVVSRGSYHFWGDRKKGFREIYRVLKPGAVAYIGRGFPRNLPTETARKIRAKQGGGPKYDRQDEARALRKMMSELGIRDFRVEVPKPAGGEDVSYGVWVEFRKPGGEGS